MQTHRHWARRLRPAVAAIAVVLFAAASGQAHEVVAGTAATASSDLAPEPASAPALAATATAMATGAPTGGMSANLPLRRDKPDNGAGTAGLGFGMALLVGLICLAIYVAMPRRGGQGRPAWKDLLSGNVSSKGQGTLSRISSQTLTPQASVHAVTWHGEELLLGCTPQSVTVLARHPVSTQASVPGEGPRP